MVLLLFACTSEPSSQTEDVAIPPAYDVGNYATDDRPDASFDQAAVEEGLQAAIDAALSAPAQPVIDGYNTAMAFAEETCPYTYEVDGNLFWYDDCTTSTGATFSGYGTYLVYDGVDALGDGTPMSGAAVYGEGRIVTPDGEVFESGGSAGALEGTSDEGIDLFINITEGAFAWDGAEAADTWLATDLAPSLTIYAAVIPAYNVHYVTIDGGINGITGASSAPTAAYAGVQFADEAVGFPCDEEPTGTVSIRDRNGTWYDVAFDVSDEGQLTGDCDGCGTVTLNGVEVGQACADFSPWLDWGDRPW